MQFQTIGLVGYGEVGKIFSAGLKTQNGVQSMGAWDLKFERASTQVAEHVHAAHAGVVAHSSCRALGGFNGLWWSSYFGPLARFF